MLSATKLRRLAFCAFIALDIEDTKIFNSCKLLQDTEHMHCCMRHGGCWGFTTVPVTVGVFVFPYRTFSTQLYNFLTNVFVATLSVGLEQHRTAVICSVRQNHLKTVEAFMRT